MSSPPSSENTSDATRTAWAWALACGWALLVWKLGGDDLSAENTSRFFGPLIAWLLPGISEEMSDGLQFVIRRTAHVMEYGLLAFLLLRAFVASGWPPLRGATLAAFCLATAFAAADETRQSLSATRLGSVWDVALDTVGALSGVGLLLWTRVSLPGLARSIGLFGPQDHKAREHEDALPNEASLNG